MDDFDVFAAKPASTPENDLFEVGNSDAPADNQKDESSWVIENNPGASAPSQPDVLGEDNLTSSASTALLPSDDIFDNTTSASDPPVTLDDSIFDSATPSQTATTVETNMFDDHEPLQTTSPSANGRFENSSLSNMFVNESASPLQAITKQRNEEIAAKDAEERRKIDELRQQAKADLDRWYKDRERQMEQNRQNMKTSEDDLRTKALEKSSKETCDWSKVIRLLELNDGTQLSKSKRDLTRMKSCLLTARRANENKKVANGV